MKFNNYINRNTIFIAKIGFQLVDLQVKHSNITTISRISVINLYFQKKNYTILKYNTDKSTILDNILQIRLFCLDFQEQALSSDRK